MPAHTRKPTSFYEIDSNWDLQENSISKTEDQVAIDSEKWTQNLIRTWSKHSQKNLAGFLTQQGKRIYAEDNGSAKFVICIFNSTEEALPMVQGPKTKPILISAKASGNTFEISKRGLWINK